MPAWRFMKLLDGSVALAQVQPAVATEILRELLAELRAGPAEEPCRPDAPGLIRDAIAHGACETEVQRAGEKVLDDAFLAEVRGSARKFDLTPAELAEWNAIVDAVTPGSTLALDAGRLECEIEGRTTRLEARSISLGELRATSVDLHWMGCREE